MKLVIRLVMATGILLAAGVPGSADEESPQLLKLELHKGRLQVTPQGDIAKSFSVDPAEAEWIGERWVASDRLAISNDSLFLDGRVYPRERMGRMKVDRVNNHVEVVIYDRGEAARKLPRKHNETSVGSNLIIRASEFIRGYVLSFGGDVRVRGEVNRSVVCVGGNAFVDDGGVVRGSVVSLGGNVHKSDDATVYGDMFAGNRRTFRPRWFEDDEENIIDFDLALDYNRVTGALPWALFDVGPAGTAAPSLKARIGYAFESELWHYRLGVGHDKPRGPLYYAGAYRETLSDDEFRIGRDENTVYALLFRTDYRDYYFAEGFKLEAGWALGRDRRVTLGYHNELINELPAFPRLWSLFGGDPFRDNYAPTGLPGVIPLVPGEQSRLAFIRAAATYHLPYFTEPESGSWQIGLRAESSEPGLGSDYTYTRAHAWISRTQPLWHDQSLRIRVAGGGSGGAIPEVRQFYLGGISSLPGYDYKEFAGDRFWLGNLEYIWDINTTALFAAADAGQIGSNENWTDSRILFDAGLGITIEDAFRVQLSWPLAGESRDPLVTFRLSRPF